MDRAALQERFGIVGRSAALGRVLDRIRLVARTDVTVLLEGESGVGKEGLAEVLHALSPRRHKSLVVVNCGAIPEGLIESELFGAEKGAYTGSVDRRTGYFEEADGGTIFLDEIGEMPLAAQVRLLRVLETGQFTRVGSSQARTVDVRVVAATNRQIAREVGAGRFREDLYYRLSTVQIVVPPLRERAEDVLPLAAHFLRQFAERYQTTPRRLDDGAERLLTSYAWPGNVRELRNVAEQAVVLTTEPTLTAEMLRPMLRGVSAGGHDAPAGALVLAAREGHGPRSDRSGVRDADGGDDRSRELLYRALLELRLDVRELREQLATLLAAVQVTREDFASAQSGTRGPGFVIVRDDPAPLRPERPGHEDFRGEDFRREDFRGEDLRGDGFRSAPPASGLPLRGGALVGRAPAGVWGPDAPREPEVEDAPFEIAGPTRPTQDAGDETGAELRADGGAFGDDRLDDERLDVVERRLIARALRRYDGNRRQAAAALGISERTLYRKIRELEAQGETI